MHQLKAKRSRDVVCFYPMEVPTKEGDAYVFLAKDIYSEFLFQTGIERSNGSDMVLKHIALLMEDKNFKRFGKLPFTLVLHKHEDLKPQVEQIIRPFGGTMVVDDLFLTEHMADVIEHFFRTMARR